MLIAKTVHIMGHFMNPAEKGFKWFSAFIFLYYIKPVTWQCKLSNMLWIVPSSNGRKVEKNVFKGSVLNQLNMTFVPDLHAHLPKPQKISGQSHYPLQGCPVSLLLFLCPEKILKDKLKRNFVHSSSMKSCFWIISLKQCRKKRLFWHPPLLLPSRHKIQIDSEETVDLPTEGKQDSFRFI